MEWVEIVTTVGFPIALASYLLLRFEKIIKENTDVTIQLKETIQRWMEYYRPR